MWLGGRKDLAEALKVYSEDYSAKGLAKALKVYSEDYSAKDLAEALKVYRKDYSAKDLAGVLVVECLAEALKACEADHSAKNLAGELVGELPELDPQLDGIGLAEASKAYDADYLARLLVEKFPKLDPRLNGIALAEALKVYREDYSAKDLAHVLVEKFPKLDPRLKGEGLAEALKAYNPYYSAEDLAGALLGKFPESRLSILGLQKLKGEDLAKAFKVYRENYSAKDLAHALVGQFPELKGEGLAEALKVYKKDYSAEDLAHALVRQFPELKEEDLANVLKVYNPGYSAKDLAHALVGQFPELKGEDLANVLKVYKEDYSAKDLAEGLAKALKAHKADSAKDLAEGLAKVLKAYKADHPVKDLADVLALEFGKMGVQDRISMLQSAFPDKLREILEDLMKPKLSPLSRAEMIKNVDIDDQDLYQLVKVIINKQSDQLELVAEAIATVKPHLETNTLLEAIFRSFSKNPEDTSVKTYEKQESKIIICAIAIEKAKAKAVEKEPPTKEYLTKVALQFFKHKKLYMDDDFINKKKLTSIIKLLQSNIDIGRDLSSSKSYESVRREADSLISFRKNEGCEVTDILTAEIMKDMSTHTSTTEKIVREELEKAQKGEQEQTKKEEQEGQQSKPSASVKHPQCMTHRINNQCELARLMMRCK